MKRALNLDSMFVPLSMPEIKLADFFEFNGGEMHVKLRVGQYVDIDEIVITTRIQNSAALMELLMVHNAVKLMFPHTPISLIMPYLPYARQDRVCNEGEAFSLKVFTDLINNMNLYKVIILDAHSDVGPALINNCINRSNRMFVEWCIEDILGMDLGRGDVTLICPDAGANKKMHKLQQELIGGRHMPLIKCDKVRNPEDGKLSGFEVFTDDLKERRCMIIDDICDGGGTFIGLAKELKKKNAGDLYLIVTHGIFSAGLQVLIPYFKGVYCTNSFKNLPDMSWFKQYKIAL